MRPARELALVALLVTLFSVTASHIPACGPYFERAIFHYQRLPVPEQTDIAAGRIGVIQPRYRLRFLLVAYRYLSGVPLSDAEQSAFLDPADAAEDGAPVLLWPKTRALVPGAGDAPAISPYRRVPGSNWQVFLNCPPDALRTATSTLTERMARFGADSPAVLSWVRAQDAAFSNCSEGKTIPEPAGGGLTEIIAKDRAYQIAAAYFYSLDFDEARRRFTQIGEDQDSPWRDIAPYLVARCLIRKASLGPEEPDLLSRAREQLRAVIDDPSRASVHDAAGGLLRYVEGRFAPGAALARAGVELARASSGEEFRGNLRDVEWLMEKRAAGKPAAHQSELVDWVVTVQDRRTKEPLAHSIERWRATARDTWLVAALMKLPADHDEVEPLLAAAAKVKPASAAWATATYHRVRLLIAVGHRDEARAVLDRALPLAAKLAPDSAWNLFRGQRFAIGTTRAEFLRYAERRVTAVGDLSLWWTPPEEGQPRLQFDGDAVAVLNQGLPVAELARIAEEESLSAPMRREVALLAFTRALLLDETELARKLAGRRGLEISLRDDVEVRRFETALLLLRHPALRPYLVSGFPIRRNLTGVDRLRDNGWCSLTIGESLDGLPYAKRQQELFPEDSPRARRLPNLLRFSMTPPASVCSTNGAACWPSVLRPTISPPLSLLTPAGIAATRASPKRSTSPSAPPASAAATRIRASTPSAPTRCSTHATRTRNGPARRSTGTSRVGSPVQEVTAFNPSLESLISLPRRASSRSFGESWRVGGDRRRIGFTALIPGNRFSRALTAERCESRIVPAAGLAQEPARSAHHALFPGSRVATPANSDRGGVP